MHELQTGPSVVEMVRDARALHGRDRFSCTLEEWRSVLKVAQTFGWQPRGTTYELSPRSKIDDPARRDYEPGEPADRKRVDDDDANALALALSQAREAPDLTSTKISREEFRTLLSELAQYAFGGAFMFALSDGDSADTSAVHRSG